MSLLDQIKAKQKEMESKKARDFSVSPPPGNSRWRILPHWSGDAEQLPVHDFGQHFIKDPIKKEVQAVVVCAAKTYGTECEVCTQIETLSALAMASNQENEANVLKDARAAQKHLVNAVRWEKGKGYDEEVVQLSLPMTAFEQLMLHVENYLIEGVNIFDMAEGIDVIIVRSGSGRNTTYTVLPAPKSTAIDAKYLEKGVNLEDFVNQINEEKTRKALAALRGTAGALPAASVTALPASVASATPPPAAPAESAPEETIAAGPESVADALGDVDLADLDLDDLADVV